VWLDPTERQLVQCPVEELNVLREKEVSMNNQKLETGIHVEVAGITASLVG
jgi:beta-fructofuranosidase